MKGKTIILFLVSVLILLVTMYSAVATLELRENYNDITNRDGEGNVNLACFGQSFGTSSNQASIDRVDFYMKKDGTMTTDNTLYIRSSSCDGSTANCPTGALSSYNIPQGDYSTSNAWLNITTNQIVNGSSTYYAYICNTDANNIYWQRNGSSPTYPNGTAYTSIALASFDALFAIYEDIPSPPSDYTITVIDAWDSSAVNNITLTINGTTYTNTSGNTIYTHVKNNETFLWDINVTGENYYNKTFLNQNLTSDPSLELFQTQISFNAYQLVTNTSINGVTFTIGSQTNGTFLLKAGSYNVTASKNNYYNLTQEISVTALENNTLNVTGLYNQLLNLSLVHGFDSSTISNVTGWVSNTNYSFNTSFTSNNVPAVQGLNYTVFVNPSGYTSGVQSILTNNSLVYPVNFTLFSFNSVRINIYNGTTTNYLNQLVTINQVTNISSVTNTTSNGSIYLSLLEPSSYELRFVSANFNSQSIFINVNNDSTQTINVYMISNSSTELQRVQVNSFEGNTVEGAIVRLQIQVSDESDLFFTIDEKTTNSEGETAFFVEKDLNVYYRFIVVFNDVVKLTTVETFFIPAVDEIITLTISTSSVSGVNIEGLSVSYTLVKSGSSNETFTFTWADAKNEITGGRLVVLTQDLNFTDFSPATLYDSGIITGFTGVDAYTLPIVNNTKFTVRGYIVYNTYEEKVKEEIRIFGTTVSIDRNAGLLLGIVVFVIVVLLTLSFGPLFSGVIGFIALLGLSLIGLVTIPVAIITSFIAFLFIVFVKVNTRGGGA